ncbi:transmembrane protein, putative (macronuclear) [Tetrahymena thermophila SB210]|uniref:Transmembrane protein, putative n=1 Tax=Tetrahymena thermophila (strain SB210) TaxID=312017 RepID=Q233X5_TETTS|nr:transmembrane protein, putative [Tetrahymena thermophila SB210]EAR91809.4 transmembrane protein, putative [Tetrahymena thermophila SB210]|eukprot:XP_001012054.4 transmembrane protein, putative [Tetrahymena thermophila SB210]
MDFTQLIGTLYSTKKENIQCSGEQNKNKWINMLNLLNSFENSQAKSLQSQQQNGLSHSDFKNSLLKNSTLQLFCQCQEQLEYLVNLQMKFQERGLKLREDLNEQQMLEVGLCFAIILILENDFISHEFFGIDQNKTQPAFKSIHKVLNYDYFIDNSSNENLQRYEEITYKTAQSTNNQTENISTEKNNELEKYLQTELKHTSSSPQLQSQSPLKIQIQNNQHQKSFSTQNYFSQNLYKNSQAKCSTISQTNKNQLVSKNQSQNVLFQENHILNLSILFYRFFNSFQMSYDTFSSQTEYSLSNQFQNAISEQQFNFNFCEKVLRESQKKDESNVFQEQKYITPKRLTTPDAIKLIENNQSIISDNKENQKGNVLESNIYTNSFEKSVINQNQDILNFFFEDPSKKLKKSNRHSMDCLGDKMNDSPMQLKNFHMSKKKEQRFESCVINGNNNLFEESQLIINKLDLQKRRYQQYSQEQSKLIQELHSLYIDLKTKYESLQQSSLNFSNDQEAKQKVRESQQNFSIENKQKNIVKKSDFQQINTQNCEFDNSSVNEQKQNQKNDEQIFESKIIQSSTLSQSNIKTSECNPMTMQLNYQQKNKIFTENDSDINRRQVHDDILSQNFLFQSVNINQSNCDQLPQQNSLNPEDQQSIIFNYVNISDIWNSSQKSSHELVKHKKKKDEEKSNYSKKDIVTITFLILLLFCYFLLIFYY